MKIGQRVKYKDMYGKWRDGTLEKIKTKRKPFDMYLYKVEEQMGWLKDDEVVETD